jgi:hypothetical protein
MFSLKLRARCSSVTSAVKKDRELGIEDENEKEHEDERETQKPGGRGGVRGRGRLTGNQKPGGGVRVGVGGGMLRA